MPEFSKMSEAHKWALAAFYVDHHGYRIQSEDDPPAWLEPYVQALCKTRLATPRSIATPAPARGRLPSRWLRMIYAHPRHWWMAQYPEFVGSIVVVATLLILVRHAFAH